MSIGNGFLGKNDYKKKDNQPDYTGKCTVNTEEYRIAGWIMEKGGRKYISLAFNEPKPDSPRPQDNPVEDDIPF